MVSRPIQFLCFSLIAAVCCSFVDAEEQNSDATVDNSNKLQVRIDSLLVSNIIRLLSSETLRKELEISDEQHLSVENAASSVTRLKNSLVIGYSEQVESLVAGAAPNDSGFDRFAREFEESRREVDRICIQKIEGILLPHQMKRLRQIAAQRQFDTAMHGIADFVQPLYFADLIGFSEKEKELMTGALSELYPGYQEELAELNEKYLDRMLKGVSEDKRDAFKALVGEKYHLHDERGKQKLKNVEDAVKRDQ
jgi:hypothetical protein